MTEFKLAHEIIKLSTSKVWDKAKLEWDLHEIYKNKDYESCLCGHYPIVEICVLENKINKQKVTVGNFCVNNFLGLTTDKLFRAISRVQEDNNKSFNAEVIDLASQNKWISKRDRNFYLDILRKQKMSQKQWAYKVSINKKLLTKLIKQ